MKQEILEQFSRIKELLSEDFIFEFSEPVFEKESKDYWACQFKINNQKVIYRKAKITPTKVGQFVALWKRKLTGPIQPFHIDDNLDIVIISTKDKSQIGCFIFPKSVLIHKRIIFSKIEEGKRGFRVYPPWDEAKNKQAKKTQEWQLEYFLSISNFFDVDKAKHLFNFSSK